MPQKSFTDAPIVLRGDPITREQIGRFVQATGSEYCDLNPLTFPTVFRAPEFKWLDRLKIDIRNLLHTDQEYEYHFPLKPGDVPTVYCRMADMRERKGLIFVALENEVRCGDKVAITGRTSFLVRKPGAEDAT